MCVSDGCEKKVPALYQHPRAYVCVRVRRDLRDDSSSSISVRTVIISTGKRRLRRHWRPGRFSRGRRANGRARDRKIIDGRTRGVLLQKQMYGSRLAVVRCAQFEKNSPKVTGSFAVRLRCVRETKSCTGRRPNGKTTGRLHS